MTIFVTGGAGFIGSNFILEWVAKSDETIINLDKLTYAGNLENLVSVSQNPHYVFIEGDIGDTSKINTLLAQYKPRAILNFAAESHVDRSIHGPSDFINTNIVSTFNLLECVRTYWSNLPLMEQNNFRFLHVSTDEVYGSLANEDAPFTEDNKYAPNRSPCPRLSSHLWDSCSHNELFQ
jgi:dTDP-glucose 4,6-dehydratase